MKFQEYKDLFLGLTEVTVPHGSEYMFYHGYMRALIDIDLTQRGENFYYVVGDGLASKTLFCSHLDTAGRDVSRKVYHQEFNSTIFTRGDTILGADNKAGVATLLYLINQGVPGTYYFFAGEEVGGIGSRFASQNDTEFFKHFDRAIAFDRRDKGSIISHQWGGRCASPDFVSALSGEYGSSGVKMHGDPGGSFTDTASFTDQIEECTNISIGFNREHSTSESLNIDYAYQVAMASAQVDWESLPTARNIYGSSNDEDWGWDDGYGYYDRNFSNQGNKYSLEAKKRADEAKARVAARKKADEDKKKAEADKKNQTVGTFSDDGTEYYPPKGSNHAKPMPLLPPPAPDVEPPFSVSKNDLDSGATQKVGMEADDIMSLAETIEARNNEKAENPSEEDFDDLLNPSGGKTPPNVLS